MDWTRGHTLGRGSTATVSMAKDHRSGRVFAVKSAELHQSEYLMSEQGILSTLKCPQIVAYKGCDVTLEDGVVLYNLFMEYAPYGTLADASRLRSGLDEASVRTYARQILLGLNHLHNNGIAHCDIKGKNVLVTEEGAKIADLGCARRVGEVAGSGGVIAGTPVFMAPEVARGEQQGFPADVWALGCTVLEMTTGQAPWHEVSNPVTVLYRIGFSGEVPEIPGFMSEQGKDFLSKCLKRDPNERWSVGELLRHGFVQESCSILKEFDYDSSNSDTPTSVLDRSIWESFETTQDPTHNCSWNSAKDRIRRLCAETTTSFDAKPNCEWDEDWITVRGNGAKGSNVQNPNEKTGTCGSDTDYIRKEESLALCYKTKTVINIGLCNCNFNSYVCYYSCCNRELLSTSGYPCSCTNIIVLQSKIESQIKQENFFLILFLFLYSHLYIQE